MKHDPIADIKAVTEKALAGVAPEPKLYEPFPPWIVDLPEDLVNQLAFGGKQ